MGTRSSCTTATCHAFEAPKGKFSDACSNCGHQGARHVLECSELPSAPGARALHRLFAAVRNARAAAGLWRSGSWCMEFCGAIGGHLASLDQYTQSASTTVEAVLSSHREVMRLLPSIDLEDAVMSESLIKLLISLDEMYYRVYYLSQSEQSAALPDPSLYFSEWAWAAEEGLLDEFKATHLC